MISTITARRAGGLAIVTSLAASLLGGGAADASRAGSEVSTSTAETAAPALGVTWLLEDASDFRLAPPPANRSPKTASELDRLLDLQKKRSKKIRRQIRFWNNGPATRRWTERALALTLKYKQRPAPAARLLALFHTGMADAVLAANDTRAAYHRRAPAKLEPRLKPLLGARGTTYPPHQAVVAGAAETLLAYLFPNEPPEDIRARAAKAVKSRLWAGVNYPSDVKRGRRLGRKVAELFITRGEADGHTNTGFSNPRPPGDEYWEKTPPAFEEALGGPVGTWLPWGMSSPDEARFLSEIPGPFVYGSPEFMAETQEVIDVQEMVTAEQQDIARFWDDGIGTYTPAGHWIQIADSYARAENAGTLKTAQLMAYLSAGAYDAVVASFEAKYHWWSIRPVTVIRRMCDDGTRFCTKSELDPAQGGDPALATYPDWEPFLLTPPFPAYPSGHATMSGATSTVLSAFFPGAAEAFTGLAEEAAMSRLWGGIHFRSDNDDGLQLGRAVANLVLNRSE